MGQVEREIDRYGLEDIWTRILGKIEREEAGKQGNKMRGSSNKGHLSGSTKTYGSWSFIKYTYMIAMQMKSPNNGEERAPIGHLFT